MQKAARKMQVVASGAKVRRSASIRTKPKSPMTIDGTLASRSTPSESRSLTRPFAKRARYSPKHTPGSAAISVVSTTRQSVPASAGHIPSQTGRRPRIASSAGVSPKKSFGPSTGRPWLTMKNIRAPQHPATYAAPA